MTRATSIALAFFAVLSLSVRASEITFATPKSDFMTQVDRVLMPALLAELDKHPVSAAVTFTFVLDERSHQSALEVSSTPRDRSAEQLVRADHPPSEVPTRSTRPPQRKQGGQNQKHADSQQVKDLTKRWSEPLTGAEIYFR